MKSRLLVIVFIIFSWKNIYSQVGGDRSFEFIHIPSDALYAGLGGQNVSLYNKDVNLFFANPSLSGGDMAGQLSLNYLGFPGNNNLTGFSYTHGLRKIGIVNIGLRYLSYGEIDAFDPAGSPQGSFSARDYMLVIGHTRKVNNFSVGANLKFVNSRIAGYSASSFMFDIGGVFVHPQQDFTAGLVIKNLGFVVSEFSDSSESDLPFDVQVGTSFKPQYMPVRFSVTIHSLYERDLVFFQPDEQGGEGEDAGMADKIFRHVVIGGEFLINKNLNLRLGYNHQKRRELRLEQTSGGAGFSYGLMIKIKAFEFAYTRTNFHVGSAANNFTLTSNLNSLIIKKETNTL